MEVVIQRTFINRGEEEGGPGLFGGQEEEEMASLDLLLYPTVHTILDEIVLRITEGDLFLEWDCTSSNDYDEKGVIWTEALNLQLENVIFIVQTLIGTLLHTILVVITVLALIATAKEKRSTVQRVIYSGAMIDVSPLWMTKEQREEPVTVMIQKTSIQPKKTSISCLSSNTSTNNNGTQQQHQPNNNKIRQLSSDEETYTMDYTEDGYGDVDGDDDDNNTANINGGRHEVSVRDASSIFRRTSAHQPRKDHQFPQQQQQQQQEHPNSVNSPEVGGNNGAASLLPTKVKDVKELIAEIEQKGNGSDATSNGVQGVQGVKWMKQQKIGCGESSNSAMVSNNHHLVKDRVLCSKTEGEDAVPKDVMVKVQETYITHNPEIEGATPATDTTKTPDEEILITVEPTDETIEEIRKREVFPISKEQQVQTDLSMGEATKGPTDVLENTSTLPQQREPIKNETTSRIPTSLEEDLKELEVAMSSFQQLLQKAKEAA